MSTPSVVPKPYKTVYAFGPESIIKKKWRVKGIIGKRSDKGETTFLIRCEDYYDALYPADNFDPKISWSTHSGAALANTTARPLTQVQINQSINPITQIIPFVGSGVPATETDPIVGAVDGIVKADGEGNISAAEADTDYMATGGGVAGTLVVDDGTTEKVTLTFDADGRLTSRTVQATTGSVLIDWTD